MFNKNLNHNLRISYKKKMCVSLFRWTRIVYWNTKTKKRFFSTTRLKMTMQWIVAAISYARGGGPQENTYTYLHDLVRSRVGLHRVTRQNLPVIEHALWESLTAGIGAQISGETERFVYGKVSLNYEHGSTRHLLFFEYVTSPTVQHAVNSTDCYLWTL